MNHVPIVYRGIKPFLQFQAVHTLLFLPAAAFDFDIRPLAHARSYKVRLASLPGRFLLHREHNFLRRLQSIAWLFPQSIRIIVPPHLG